ncbi:hypothetical protein D3C85_1118560 [compost metagenome]
MLHAEQVFQPGRHLQRTNPQVGHQAQQGHEHAEAVHRMTGRALDPALAHQRIQRRTQRQRLVMTVSKVGNGQTDQCVDRPAVQAPVQEGQLHRLTRGHVGSRCAFRRIEVVIQWLGCAEVQQRNTDTRREQHPRPGAVTEIRGVVLAAQFEFAVRGKRQAHHKHQVGGDDHHVVPAEAARQPGLSDTQQSAGLLRGDNQNGGQQQNQRGRGVKHPTVDRHLLGRGLYKRGRTHGTNAPGSAREEHKATRNPTNRLVGSRPAGDIKTPRKMPEPAEMALRIAFVAEGGRTFIRNLALSVLPFQHVHRIANRAMPHAGFELFRMSVLSPLTRRKNL